MSSMNAQVDEKAKKFLRAVQYYGGEATTTDIRQRTGLNQPETQYRFTKLERLGLIEVGYADTGTGDRDPPRVAKLTGKARAEIERGLLGTGDASKSDEGGECVDEVSEEAFLAVRRDLERLEQRVNVLTQSRSKTVDGDGEPRDDGVRERLENLEERLNDLRDDASDAGAPLEGDISASPAVRGLDERVASLEADFADFEEYVYQWNEAVETYLYAIRRVFEERDGVTFDSYLELASESDRTES